MSGYSSKILGNAASALQAQQAAIATTSNNISNVNTPGYARRTINLETRQGADGFGVSVGDGVNIAGVTRNADKYLEQLLQTATGESGSSTTENEFLDRVQSLFTLSTDRQTVGSTLTDFFSSLNDLTNNPSSIELRTNVISKANDVVNSLKDTFNKLGQMQDEIDQRLGSEFTTVNSITAQIAKLNVAVAGKEAGGGLGSAVDERDARDQLVQQLAGKISFQSSEQSDGSLQIRLATGFPLVSGSTSKAIEFTKSPSFAVGAPASVSGASLSYAVYNYGNGTTRSDIDLTEALKAGQGSIGGLLRTRGTNDPSNASAFDASGTIPETAARLEAITRSLLTDVNKAYLGANATTRAVDLDGNPPATFGLFDFKFAGTKDAGANVGVPETDDLNAVLATGTVKNFTSLLQVTTTDPRKIAAALDSSGNSTGPTTFASGDGRNIAALAALENQSFAQSAGAYSTQGSLNDAYRQSVTYVGNLKSSANTAAAVSESNLTAAQAKRDSFSGVNLDEEFTSLITNQQAYQAAAKMIRTASDMFDQLMNLL